MPTETQNPTGKKYVYDHFFLRVDGKWKALFRKAKKKTGRSMAAEAGRAFEQHFADLGILPKKDK